MLGIVRPIVPSGAAALNLAQRYVTPARQQKTAQGFTLHLYHQAKVTFKKGDNERHVVPLSQVKEAFRNARDPKTPEAGALRFRIAETYFERAAGLNQWGQLSPAQASYQKAKQWGYPEARAPLIAPSRFSSPLGACRGFFSSALTFKETKNLPVIDPAKNLIGDWQTSETGCQAYSYVQQRIAKEGLVMSYEGNRTKPFPVMPGVCCLHKQAEALLQQQIKTVFSALQKIVAAYHHDTRLQAFLAIPQALNDWVMQDSEPSHRSIDLCRFDMIGGNLDTLRIIEFNANAPGGIVYFGLINTYWREAPGTAELINHWGSVPSAFERPDWFSDWMTNLANRRGLTSINAIGLLHPLNGNMLELPHLQKRLQHQGYQCTMMPPSDAYQNGKPLWQAAYLKYGVQRALKDMSQWARFCTGVINNEMIIPSSLSGRWIGDNKLCLAVMSEPRFSYLFNSVEQQVIRQMIPYSRKLGDGISAENILAHKDNWVIKNPYDTRGAGVFVGRDHTEAQWRKRVADQHLAGFLVQEYIDSCNSTAGDAAPYFRDLMAIIASGRIVGYSSRISSARKMNVAQQGQILSVLSAL